jgi:hypothetical protein
MHRQQLQNTHFSTWENDWFICLPSKGTAAAVDEDMSDVVVAVEDDAKSNDSSISRQMASI